MAAIDDTTKGPKRMATPTPIIRDDSQRSEAHGRLRDIRQRAAAIGSQIDGIGQSLGEALAALTLGVDAKAQPKPNELTLKLAELEQQRRDLQLTATAVEGAITAFDAAAAANAGFRAWAQASAIADEARAVEAEYGRHLVALVGLWWRLRRLRKEFIGARSRAYVGGTLCDDLEIPRDPSSLLPINKHLMRDADAQVRRWQGEWVPLPPSGFAAVIERRQAEVIEAVNADHREGRPVPLRFVQHLRR